MQLYVILEDAEPKSKSGLPTVEKRIIKLNTSIPEDEDFGL